MRNISKNHFKHYMLTDLFMFVKVCDKAREWELSQLRIDLTTLEYL